MEQGCPYLTTREKKSVISPDISEARAIFHSLWASDFSSFVLFFKRLTYYCWIYFRNQDLDEKIYTANITVSTMDFVRQQELGW